MYIYVLYLMVSSIVGLKLEDYLKERNTLMQKDYQQLGSDLELSADEKRVDKYLLKMKQKEYYKFAAFPLQEQIFMKVKDKIEKQPVFKFIRKMPKGAVNHIHDMALGSYVPLIKKWTYLSECYMCHNLKDARLTFKMSRTTPQPIAGCSWVSAPQARQNASSVEEFDNVIFHYLTLSAKDIFELKPQSKLWAKFQNVFTTMYGLYSYDEILKDYTKVSMDELLADNIQFIEIKSVLPALYAIDGCLPGNPIHALKVMIDATEEFKEKHKQDYFGAKFIYSVLRSEPREVISKAVLDAIEMKKKFPDHFAGFDLVGQEDLGASILHLIKELLIPLNKLNTTLQYIFHAGETDFYGNDVDENLFDAVLLNTSRIGHGYALTKHPVLKKQARENNIAVELCPISNQVLGLVADIRDHSGSQLMAENFPVTINPDDPPIWGASGVSYDFYQAFMGMLPQHSGLAALKKLALNSIEYSSLNKEEMVLLKSMWQRKWDEFILNMIHEIDDVSMLDDL